MKIKYTFLIIMMLFICGCQKINETSLESITSSLAKTINKENTYHNGFSYYIPSGLSLTSYNGFNEVLENDNYVFYLYVDLISYYNKVDNKYTPNTTSFYSVSIQNDDKYGYLEINLKENNQYLIEIMYNYAKIEVMVDKSDINLAVKYAVSILRSIKYNDVIIENMLGNDVLSFQEEVYNIFNTTSADSVYLKAAEEEQQQVEEIKDTDLVN